MSDPIETTTIRVEGAAPYDVVVGRGLSDRVAAALDPRTAKVLIVHAPTLGRKANELRDALVEAGLEALIAEVPDSEDA